MMQLGQLLILDPAPCPPEKASSKPWPGGSAQITLIYGCTATRKNFRASPAGSVCGLGGWLGTTSFQGPATSVALCNRPTGGSQEMVMLPLAKVALSRGASTTDGTNALTLKPRVKSALNRLFWWTSTATSCSPWTSPRAPGSMTF